MEDRLRFAAARIRFAPILLALTATCLRGSSGTGPPLAAPTMNIDLSRHGYHPIHAGRLDGRKPSEVEWFFSDLVRTWPS